VFAALALPTTMPGLVNTALVIASDVVLVVIVLLTIKNAFHLVTGGGLVRFFTSMLPIFAIAGLVAWIRADPAANIGTLASMVGSVIGGVLSWLKTVTA